MEPLENLVRRAQQGDVHAYGEIVRTTERMVLAVSCQVLRDAALAQDAAQETYLRVFRRVHEVREPRAFVAWLRRVAITVAMNMRRARRGTFLRLDDVLEVPVLDEDETECRGRKLEVLAWGIFTDRIVRHVGGNPRRHTAVGIGYGLERLASLRCDIDDIRKVDAITLSA